MSCYLSYLLIRNCYLSIENSYNNTVLKFFCTWKQRCKEHTDVSDVNRNVEQTKDVVDAARCDHQTRVHCATNNSAQWVPGSLVKPIEEIIETMFDHIGCRSVVEPEMEEQLIDSVSCQKVWVVQQPTNYTTYRMGNFLGIYTLYFKIKTNR